LLHVSDEFSSDCFSRLPDIDHEVRWCLLKLADLLIKPETETPPTVKIHIPSTPVVEVAPPIPSTKSSRNLKSGGPPLKIPLPTAAPPTKLKIPATPTAASPRLPPTPVAPEPPKKSVTFAPPPPPVPVQAPPPAVVVPPKAKVKPPKAPVVPSKPVAVPKVQTAGMSVHDYRGCKSALKKLRANKHAALFLQPVDPIRDQAPK
jgi:transcription initiation factor TFIID subunit 2